VESQLSEYEVLMDNHLVETKPVQSLAISTLLDLRMMCVYVFF